MEYNNNDNDSNNNNNGHILRRFDSEVGMNKIELSKDSDTISENFDNVTDNASECMPHTSNMIGITTPGVLVENESIQSQSQQPHSPQVSSLHFKEFENEEQPCKKRVFKLEFSPSDSPVTEKFKSNVRFDSVIKGAVDLLDLGSPTVYHERW